MNDALSFFCLAKFQENKIFMAKRSNLAEYTMDFLGILDYIRYSSL